MKKTVMMVLAAVLVLTAVVAGLHVRSAAVLHTAAAVEQMVPVPAPAPGPLPTPAPPMRG